MPHAKIPSQTPPQPPTLYVCVTPVRKEATFVETGTKKINVLNAQGGRSGCMQCWIDGELNLMMRALEGGDNEGL